jgi:ketosteroid isomerase-like protein
MSQANVDLVRAILADWERGDFSSAAWADPDIEFMWADSPDNAGWKGLDGLSAAMGDFLNQWDEYRVEAIEFRTIDEERVLVLLRPRGQGKTSGLDLERTSALGANIFRVRDGKVTMLHAYFECTNALADLGLAPGPA